MLAGTIAFKVYLSFPSCASSFNWITHVKLKSLVFAINWKSEATVLCIAHFASYYGPISKIPIVDLNCSSMVSI